MPSITRVLALTLSIAGLIASSSAQACSGDDTTLCTRGAAPDRSDATCNADQQCSYTGCNELFGSPLGTPDAQGACIDPNAAPSQARRHRARAHQRRLHHGGRRLRRNLEAEAGCASGFTACPLSSKSTSGFECLDLAFELTACGACGNDCTDEPGVLGVGCRSGRCTAFSCQDGYTLTRGRCVVA